MTFIRACEHITNYTSEHESRSGLLGADRFDFPDRHIEADNRLSWCLGRLHAHFGDNALYVHLKRNLVDTAQSFVKRYDRGIIDAYRRDVLLHVDEGYSPFEVSLDYCETVNRNIELFLLDKTRKMEFSLDNASADFMKFWEFIGAEGDCENALGEFRVAHNASLESESNVSGSGIRSLQKIMRLRARQ
ncbi:hypothetical protein CA51_41570 [Rosistilla oblonga]|nr:hypothetical protein CA51_41570 [Rosistilla oblonga]